MALCPGNRSRGVPGRGRGVSGPPGPRPSPTPSHLDTLLRVKLPLTTFDPEALGGSVPQVIGAIKDSGRWADLRRRAESFLTLGRLAKVADLLPSEPETLARMVESESAPQTVCPS